MVDRYLAARKRGELEFLFCLLAHYAVYAGSVEGGKEEKVSKRRMYTNQPTKAALSSSDKSSCTRSLEPLATNASSMSASILSDQTLHI